MMRRVRAMYVALLAACAICACSDLLGIDDGLPRGQDASIFDSFVPDAGIKETSIIDTYVVDVPVSPLTCGATTCNAVVQGCCRTPDPADASGELFRCVGDASDCDGGLVVTCDREANCAATGHAGDTCCAMVPDGGNVATSTQCIPVGTCTGAIMCQPGDDEVCPPDSGETCKASVSTILGYLICKP